MKEYNNCSTYNICIGENNGVPQGPPVIHCAYIYYINLIAIISYILSLLTYPLGYQSHPLWHSGCSLSPSLIHTLIDYLHLLVKSSPLDEIIILVTFVTSSTLGEIITLVIFHME